MTPTSDRRRLTRHTLRLKIPCSAKRITQVDSWPVKVRSLASLWVKVTTKTAYAPGTHLTIDLPGLTIARLMRVVAAEPRENGRGFVLLAHFVKHLTRSELDILRARVQAGHKRKTSLRRPGALRAVCHRIRISEDGPWLATAYNISSNGMGLFMDDPIEVGTFLKLEMPAGKRRRKDRLLRITRCRPGPDADWDVGGLFLKELTAEEVRALL